MCIFILWTTQDIQTLSDHLLTYSLVYYENICYLQPFPTGYLTPFTVLLLQCVCLIVGSRLLYLLQQSSSSLELRTECSVVLGSLAMGTENNIKSLVDCHIIPALLQGWGCTHTHTPACKYFPRGTRSSTCTDTHLYNPCVLCS